MGSEYSGSNNYAKNSTEQENQNDGLNSTVNEKIVQQVQKIRPKGFFLERRVSPRLKNISKDKRPYYGSGQRRSLHSSENITARNNLYQHAPNVRSEGFLLERRSSPRLKHISADRRPYYGSGQRRQLYAPKGDIHKKITEGNEWKRRLYSPNNNNSCKGTKGGVALTEKVVQKVPKMKSDRSLLQQTVSPQLKRPLQKILYSSSDQRRQIDATKYNLCDVKNKHDDRMRVPCSPNDDATEQITKLNLPMQECFHMAIEGTEDGGAKSDLVLGFSCIEHDTSAMDLEDGAYLELRRCKSCLADSMHQRFGERVRETVVGLMAFSPLMLMYKSSDNYTKSASKQETDNEVLDVTMRKTVAQQFQNKESQGLLLGRRVSPRLKNVPKDKRPYYGSTHNRQSNAAKDYVCSNSDWKRKLNSPKDDMTKKKTKIDWVMQKCLLNVARKDICDVDADTWLNSDSGPVKLENTEIKDLRSGAYLKSMGCKRSVADDICQRAGEREKQMDCFEWKRPPKDSSRLVGLVCEDISNGEEDIPIPVTNLIDPPLAPTGFKYTKSIQVARNVIVPPSPSGCNCKGNCTNPMTCSCARLNGSDFPYVRKDGGRLIEPKDVVFECGPGCGCGPNCINRISQQGIKYRLEVYRTRNKGWAVRSWDFIPSGAFVCEYIGVLRQCADLDNVSENDFIFEIDCWHTMHGIGGRERRQGDVSKHARYLVEKMDEAQSETEFCIDGASCSNVTRFINHSCDPNLFVQCVLSSHHDIRFARIVLFAADDIPPMQELAYDYGYALDSVIGPDGKIKKSPCYCGTSECRGRLY
ncbi:uncharacterized protein LOC8285689 isoform X2 [Ricinus communis]|uniref:uncharacterized protein LOC8285689 isoform X2 n=1 Tax=Ricinus communis TaxID=3988 RepID=UPI000772CC3E|nr:uncharacterized protein LOC8285689 isoform X2 [Ricinus communis]|eukprot:XP_015570661.1 uncharacterized protein LOC8285689 isoform X2 [Ricinus communis]